MNARGTVSNLIPFKPGQSGNPGGKAAGARNRLQADFLYAFADHFAKHGAAAIDRACRKNPLGYVKAAASLMPRQLDIGNPMDELADDALMGFLRAYQAWTEHRKTQKVEGQVPEADTVSG